MDERTRELFLKVHGGDQNNLPYLYIISNHKHHLQILSYLIAQGLIGHVFTDYVRHKCSGEPIRLIAEVSKGILKVNTSPKLLKGVNFN